LTKEGKLDFTAEVTRQTRASKLMNHRWISYKWEGATARSSEPSGIRTPSEVKWQVYNVTVWLGGRNR